MRTLSLLLFVTANLLGGEVTNEMLLTEIRAMRDAYESRIASLEARMKDFQDVRAGEARVVKIQKGIDRALGETVPSHAAATRSAISPDNAVRSTSAMTMGGYTEFVYVDRGDKTQQFDQLRTVLEFGAQLHERIKLYIEWEYEHGGVIKGNTTTDGELELEQAWVDLQFHDAINFRAGTILVPFGRYNLYHEAWANNLTDRPLVNRRIAPTTWWEEGVGLHGQAYDTDFLGISYEAYLFNPGRADRISTSGGFRDVRNNNNAPLYDTTKAAAFRVAFEPARSLKRFADYFELGVSGYFSGFKGRRDTGDLDDDDNDGERFGSHGQIQMWALDMTYEKSFGDKGTFGLRGEAAMAHVGPGRSAVVIDGGAAPDFLAGSPGQQGLGYYVEGYYKFWPKFLTQSAFGRDFKDPKLVLAARYDWVDLDRDSFDQRDMSRTTVGLSYRPTERVVYKFDYQIDHSPSEQHGTTLSESGARDHSDAFLFSLAVGF